jgi:hypothetical protein
MTIRNASGGEVKRYFFDGNTAPFELCHGTKISWSCRLGEMERLEYHMNMSGELALLRVADLVEADRLAVAAGIPGIELMEAAGLGVARAVQKKIASVPTVVCCGPGMNGGDGFIAARVLRDGRYGLACLGPWATCGATPLLQPVVGTGRSRRFRRHCWRTPASWLTRCLVQV